MTEVLRKPGIQFIALALCLALFASAVPVATNHSAGDHVAGYTLAVNWNKVGYWASVGAVAAGAVVLGAVAIATCPASAPLVVKVGIVAGTALVAGGTVGWGWFGRPS